MSVCHVKLSIFALTAILLHPFTAPSSAQAQAAECKVQRLADLHAKDAEAAKSEELTDAEINAAQDCIWDGLIASYAKSTTAWAKDFTGWANVSTQAYQSATHGNRYVMNFADPVAKDYAKFEQSGVMPVGAILAKPSFGIKSNGEVVTGPLFFMEKFGAGFDEPAQNWKYSLVMQGGQHNGAEAGSTPGRTEILHRLPCCDGRRSRLHALCARGIPQDQIIPDVSCLLPAQSGEHKIALAVSVQRSGT